MVRKRYALKDDPEVVAAKALSASLLTEPHRWMRKAGHLGGDVMLTREDGVRVLRHVGLRLAEYVYAGAAGELAQVTGKAAKRLGRAIVNWCERDRLDTLRRAAE